MTAQVPLYVQTLKSSARMNRQLIDAMSMQAVGVAQGMDFLVKASSMGGNLGITIRPGHAVVKGTTNPNQGSYHVTNDASVSLTCDAASTELRLDQVILQVLDSEETGGIGNLAQITILKGGPPGGAISFTNRLGAASLPDNALLLADLIVGPTFVVNIHDRRPQLHYGTVTFPVATTANWDRLWPIPVWNPRTHSGLRFQHVVDVTYDLFQSAALFWFPRRVAATAIQWWYRQSSGTVGAGSYTIGIYDSSGRKIADTGSVALSGVASGVVKESLTITGQQTFEAGMYYVLFGLDLTNVPTVGLHIYGVNGDVNVAAGTTATVVGPHMPNTFLRSSTGGVVLPNTLGAFTDVTTLTANQISLPVPLINLQTLQL